MKKVLLIISILSIIFLTGCGTFSLDGWIWPDDLEFIACIEELDTPQKIGGYMKENFTYESHVFYSPDPYTLWKIGEGDCNDFATFGEFAAHWHGYETYFMKMFYKGTFYNHAIAIYIEGGGLSLTNNRRYLNNDGFYFDSFREIVDYITENYIGLKWKKYKVWDYWDEEVEVGYNYVH